MRCPRCGNENPEQNRFCGMCGTTLLAAPETPTTQPQRTAAAAGPAAAKEAPATRTQVSEPPRPAAPTPSEPVVTGPSFLGLGDPAPRSRDNLSIDPHTATSRNLDYLLEDEGEHHQSSGVGKFILIVFALALAVGLGYLRWRNHGFGLLGAASKPNAAAQPASQSPTDSNAAPSDSQTPVSSPSPAIQPAPQPAPAPAASTPVTPAPTNAAPAQTTPAPAATDTTKPADTSNSAPNPDKPTEPAADTTAKPADTASPEAARPAPAPKPPAEVKHTPPVDPVAEAQKYLYGRGVPQDCTRGMRLLKPAAQESNPKAMVEMGALYSAGLCTPHDLPTAYRWFALALRKDPANQDVQNDLQKLWGEMTQPERQLAIRLTQ